MQRRRFLFERMAFDPRRRAAFARAAKVLAWSVAATSPVARAEALDASYPVRPIQLIVPFTPGTRWSRVVAAATTTAG